MEEKISALIERWRDQADAIRREYGDDVPHDRECVALTIEQSADELEALLRATK
jgi:hypothetical protein